MNLNGFAQCWEITWCLRKNSNCMSNQCTIKFKWQTEMSENTR